MKTVRSMALIANDPESVAKGSESVFAAFQEQLEQFGLSEEVSISLASDLGHSYDSPLVLVYPEAVIYGPVNPEDVPFIV